MTPARSIHAATIALALCAGPAMAGEIVGPARIIDGDTLEISGQRVRLAGIDAPETEQACMRNGQPHPCGRESDNSLRALFYERIAWCHVSGVDRYRRAVAQCSVPGLSDIGEAMVRAGYAVRYPQYDTAGRYTAAEAEARRERRGIWAGKFEMPWIWRKEHR